MRMCSLNVVWEFERFKPHRATPCRWQSTEGNTDWIDRSSLHQVDIPAEQVLEGEQQAEVATSGFGGHGPHEFHEEIEVAVAGLNRLSTAEPKVRTIALGIEGTFRRVPFASIQRRSSCILDPEY